MRKLLVAALLALSLGGCAQLSAFRTALDLGTASASNPITKQRYYEMENAATLVVAGLNTWKRSCIKGLINANCQAQIEAVIVYTEKIPPYMTQLRKFVRNNDQVNAQVMWNQIIDIIGIVKGQAAAAGQSIGG